MAKRIKAEITVLKLPASVQNLLGGATERALDLGTQANIRLSKNRQELTVLNTIQMEAALGFSIPFSKVNNVIFSEYDTPLTIDNEKAFYDIRATVDGIALSFTRLYIIRRRARERQWDVELRRAPDHWAELAKALTIDQLDYGTFTMSKSAIQANWALPAYEGDWTDPNTGQRPYYWPLIDYGGWCDQTEPAQGSTTPAKVVAVEDFRPLISLPYILRAGFCRIGWTVNGVIFDTELMKRAWVYALRQDYYIASKRGGRIKGRVLNRYQWTQSGADLIFTELIEGTVGYQIPGGLCGVENFPNVGLKYTFYYNGEFHNDRPQPFTAIFIVEEYDIGTGLFTGEILSTDSLIVQFAANEKKRVIFEQEVTLKFGQAAAINIQVVPNSGWYVEIGGFFRCDPANQSLMTDDIPSVADCVSGETTLLDWLKAAAHIFRLDIEPNETAKTITLHTRYRSNVFGEPLAGFFRDTLPAKDISGKIVKDSHIFLPERPDLSRYTRIEFADSSDAYIESLELPEDAPAHSRTLNNGDDLPDETEQIQNLIVEPTMEGRTTGVIATGAGNRHPFPYLPRLWDNTEGNRSFAIAPRILFAYGNVRQINPNPVNDTNELTSFYFDARPNPANTGLATNFGYASQLRTWAVTPEPPIDGNFSFNALPVSDVDLFTIFYLGYTQQQRGGTRIELLMMLNMSEYSDIDFRDFYSFVLEGLPYRVPMIDVRDFSAQEETGTPVQFEIPPVLSACCDRPCGCQFLKCDFYQDLGHTMQQATLSNMLISSFQVNDLEILTSPIPLGLLNITGIDSYPYVTNLVDALNSIGAPYFTFEYSNRLHPEKGKRFFTIKRPACYSFRILITYNGTDCYLYSDTEQATQFFTPGTWNPLGYGSEVFSAPDNCLQTTEY